MNFILGFFMPSIWLLNTSADVDSGTQDPGGGAGGAGSPVGLLLILTSAS